MKMQIDMILCKESDLPEKDLLSYLSQVVITMIDDETREKNKELLSWRNKSVLLKDLTLKERDAFNKNSSELSRVKTIGRILTIIEQLSKHGAISGPSKKKISDLLGNIESKEFHALRDLEQRLGAYLPDR